MSRHRQVVVVSTLVEQALPGVKVDAVSVFHSQKPASLFEVKLGDGRTLMLHVLLSPGKLLRSERWIIRSERAVVEWLTKDRPGNGSDKWHSVVKSIRSYLPTLVEHSSLPTESGPAYNLFEPTPGRPISSLEHPPTIEERGYLDFQKGRMLRRLARAVAPDRKFGLVAVVLGPFLNVGGATEEAPDPGLDNDGMYSWRKTFHLLLEGILRDGEDLAVTISYELVRRTFRKYGHLLDAVTTPRLVAYDADDDDVVFVTRAGTQEAAPPGDERGGREGGVAKTDPNESPANAAGGSPVKPEGDKQAMRITGLQDWSNCIFGDPLFAPGFSRSAPAFERGFHTGQDGSGAETKGDWKPSLEDAKENENVEVEGKYHAQKERQGDGNDFDDIIEDPDNAQTRILIYECYHAIVSIVTQFYRAGAHSSEREDAARRRLVSALNMLSQTGVGDTASKRPRRSSQQESPAKRSRGDDPPAPTPAVQCEPKAA
ncbi:hypothetical protein F5Y17DRAFT_463455 [Xylariaceae sp. FL0594]|nr:hypothetical protein F5Y17DRAFT_463455 [Xylariaceae sp. FL0594]